jgi:cell division transport system permease protein
LPSRVDGIQKVYCNIIMFTSIKRIIKSSWINFWRQGGLTFATCFVLVMAISLASFLFLLKDLSNYAISNLQEKVDISVYFKKDASEEDIMKIKDEVAKIPEVKSIEYVSRETALENFTKKHQDDSALIESITEIGENPLLASLNIKAWQFDQYQGVSDYLAKLGQDTVIEKIDYFQRKSIIERVSILTSAMKTAGIIIGVVLSLVAILITFNTVRLAILNQRDEIAVQRLVGASNWFIRGPFLVQGVLAGIISALISFSFFALFCWILSPKIEFLFSDLNLFKVFLADIWWLISLQLVSGIILGTFSSLIAIRRYLRT